MTQNFVNHCEDLMAHAWMVRTFVKHSPEAESFPELMGIARAVFDAARALETRAGDEEGYARMLGKKIGSLRKAAAQFAHDAPMASDHTNFRMAVRSMEACVRGLEAAMAARMSLLQASARPVEPGASAVGQGHQPEASNSAG
jgi:hypothetical protein